MPIIDAEMDRHYSIRYIRWICIAQANRRNFFLAERIFLNNFIKL
ncbi:MAG: hypothetical protein FD159_2347 [Syntrophaceae bacterium]|nr:MAG: hypothetical protein FD159_2347 [Syntrophaceae bacterium]